LAKTIAAINLAAAEYNAIVPFSGDAYRAQAIPLAIGISAAQTAAVIAQPLPQYAKGRKGGKAETAIVHGQEVIEKPDGKTWIAPGKKGTPSIAQLGQGDSVHRSMEDYQQSKLALQKASIMASFTTQNAKIQIFDHYLAKELHGVSDKIEKGIEKGFKKAKINIQNNMPPIDIGHIHYKNRGLT